MPAIGVRRGRARIEMVNYFVNQWPGLVTFFLHNFGLLPRIRMCQLTDLGYRFVTFRGGQWRQYQAANTTFMRAARPSTLGSRPTPTLCRRRSAATSIL